MVYSYKLEYVDETIPSPILSINVKWSLGMRLSPNSDALKDALAQVEWLLRIPDSDALIPLGKDKPSSEYL